MKIGNAIIIALVCIVMSGLVAFLVSSSQASPRNDDGDKLSSDMAEIMNSLDRIEGRLDALEKASNKLPEESAVQLSQRIQKTEKEIVRMRETVKDLTSDNIHEAMQVKAGHPAMAEMTPDNSKITEKVIAEIEKNPERIMNSMRKQALKKSHNPMDVLAPLELDEQQVILAQKIMDETIESYVDLASRRNELTPEEYKEESRKITEKRKEAFREILNPVQYEKYEEMEKRMSQSQHRPDGSGANPADE